MAEEFQKFLKNLAESISEEELKSLAGACQDNIPNEDRLKFDKHQDLFKYLEKDGNLGPDNLSYLEHALEKICRPDLVTQVMDFKKTIVSNEDSNRTIRGPARKYKSLDIETGDVPEDIISGISKIKLAPPPLERRKTKE
ncbi:astrocytic phosphoprotein PEA-15-like [Anneissia japonica]|uniref:astrocytic phosphoprotein PEA-15-like n=1 Tax=Anneissia japonica TaxID=1529436 RepID=UPI0014256DB4|nr:astrocytic phosphoprotein PEA-15-like [Anneissia japonica]